MWHNREIHEIRIKVHGREIHDTRIKVVCDESLDRKVHVIRFKVARQGNSRYQI